jgi:hypothetical protein
MRGARWLALAAGAGLGALGGCFAVPELTGLYQCDTDGTCPDDSLSCVDSVCCKYDGGEPACPRLPDAGVDGGQGQDAGQDAGQDPMCTQALGADCTVGGGVQGVCNTGHWSCDAGVDVCTRVLFGDGGEQCNGLDDDCDGKVDPFPLCGGPTSFLLPDASFTVGAAKTQSTVGSQPTRCWKGVGTNTPQLFNGTYWEGQGPAATADTTHLAWVEAADGGSWNLARPGERLTFAFTGVLTNANPVQSFEGWSQPIVMLCGGSSQWRRYFPGSLFNVNETFKTFSISTAINFQNPGSDWTLADESSSFSLADVQRVEILLSPKAPLTGSVSFDAGFTAFGFASPTSTFSPP